MNAKSPVFFGYTRQYLISEMNRTLAPLLMMEFATPDNVPLVHAALPRNSFDKNGIYGVISAKGELHEELLSREGIALHHSFRPKTRWELESVEMNLLVGNPLGREYEGIKLGFDAYSLENDLAVLLRNPIFIYRTRSTGPGNILRGFEPNLSMGLPQKEACASGLTFMQRIQLPEDIVIN